MRATSLVLSLAMTAFMMTVGCGDRGSDDTEINNDTGASTGADVLPLPQDDAQGSGSETGTGCVPSKTCANYAGQCGSQMNDGCVGFLDCSKSCVATGEVCVAEKCVKDAGCTPKCGIKKCGDDGCGGSCGNCAAGETCQEGKCTAACAPTCAGKVCGDDGCGATCGQCAQGESCVDGKCAGDCTPDCTNLMCGDNGCGESCGDCSGCDGQPNASLCTAGKCEQECCPDCDGKSCGSDTCGGTCGECADGKICNAGQCTDEPFGAIVMNEVQPNPASTADGDTNCDGDVDPKQDEFVEIVNVGNVNFTLDGYTLEDNKEAGKNVVYTFPQGSIIQPGGVMVVFGGGTPKMDGTSTSSNPWCKTAVPAGVVFQTIGGNGLQLNKGGDTLTLRSTAGTVQQTMSYGKDTQDGSDSLNLSPELEKGNWVVHSSLPGAIGPHSPGTRADGTPF